VKSIDFAAALLLVPSIGFAGTITAAQAREHDGETATVCGTVTNEHVAQGSRGKPTFMDLDSKFPDQVFAILVWDDDRTNVGPLPVTGIHVCATGLIQYYHGVPQMVVRSSKQLSR
jgi:hypothetical protein